MSPPSKPPQDPLPEAIFDALSTRNDLMKRATAPTGQKTFSFGDLYTFANSLSAKVPDGLEDALRQDLDLRRTFNGLLDRASLFYFPRAAAASSGQVSKRDCKGAHLSLKTSQANRDQVYLILTLEDPKARPPGELVVTGEEGVYRLALEEPFDGVIQMMLEESAGLVQSLRNPATEIFLK